MRDPFESYEAVLDKLESYLQDTLDIEKGDRKLKVRDVILPDPDDENLQAQKSAKVQGVSHSAPVKVRAQLIEDGETLDEATIKVMDLPRKTRRNTYIVDGNEYSFPLQKRLKPGVYTNKKNDGSIEAWVNSSKGVNWRIVLRPKGDFVFKLQSRIVNLFGFLVGMGVERSELRRRWGEDVYKEQKQARGAGNPKEQLKKAYEILHHESDEDVPKDRARHYREWIENYMSERSKLSPETTEVTLGRRDDSLSVDLILDATEKVIDVKRGDEDEDDKESLVFNDIYDESDFLIERLNHRQYRHKIRRTLERNLEKYDKVSKIIQKRLFQEPAKSTFTQTSLAKSPKQNNPMDHMAAASEITAMGEGGLESFHQVSRDQQAVNPTHLNFLDPMHTPEGQNIGTTLHLATGVEKDGKDLKKSVYNIRKGESEKLTPKEFYQNTVAFAEYLDRDNDKLEPDSDGKIKVMKKGDIKKVPPENVRYAIRRSTDIFGMNSLGMPFLSHNNGTRGMTAAKMQSQAKSLVHREPPKVKASVSERHDMPVEDILGKSSAKTAPMSGVVEEINEDEGYLTIQGEDGDEETVQFPKDFWLNSGNYQDTELKVEEGDEVKEGDVLGDSNYTKDGELALGTNLKTAYTPYKGLNHEDGVVVSESAAKKLTSKHAYQKTVDIAEDEETDKKKFKAYFPSAYTKEEMSHIGEDGVVKEGAQIKKGEPIVLKMRKVEEDTLSKKLKKISQQLTRDWRDTSVVWDKDVEGEVAEVNRRKDDIMVVVKTEEEARKGDKMVGRYGNKGTITTIIPDDEMPQNEEGDHMELLLNPNGVVSRMNVGQIMEVTASRIADEDGEPYIAQPFGKNHAEEIQKELDERGLEDHSTLYDPTEDEEIEGVLTGDHYTLKLEHKVDKKHSSRGAGPKYPYQLSGQPAGGSKGGGRAIGIQALYALLAHGAKENLREMYTFKGDRSMEHWRAVERNDPLPPSEMPTSSKKFTSMLRGMGINLKEQDQKVKMAPFLDDHVEQISNGEIENAKALRAKDLKEEEGGLFDYETTGGLEGQHWSHIELAEKMPHPTFDQAIRDTTKLKQSELDDIMSGNKGVIGDEVVDDPDKPGAKVGGEAIESMLESIDIDERLDEIEKKAPDKKGSELNKLHREARTLENFKDLDIDLEDMVVEKVPVLPPKMRPVIELPSGDLSVSDVNEHYRSLIMMNNQMEALQDREGLQDDLDDLRSEVYEGLKGTMGYSMGVVPNDETKGIAQTIAGKESPKHGYFHEKLLKRRQDTSGTAVVGPDPELDMDSIGIPEKMAWNIFEPYVKKDLTSQGLSPLQAEDEIEEKTDMAQDALERVMDNKHVLANRAPTLHKWSIMAFEPELTSGHQVSMPVEVLGGFNADFDGDSAICQMPILTESGLERRHIRDFPRKEKVKEEGNVEVYDVPDDVSVYGYDDQSHKIKPYSVKHFSVHHDLEIKKVHYKSGRSVEVSKDHSLYCLDVSSMGIERTRPSESKGLFTPRPKKISLPDPRDAIGWGETDSPQGTELSDKCSLDAHSGYFWGAMVGDGYASSPDSRPNCCQVGLSSLHDDIIEAVRSFIQRVGGNEGSVHKNEHTFDGHECFSKKAHWGFSQLGFKIQELIGTSSSDKRLPPFWIYGDESFRLGLVAGLLDSDGSVSVSNSKNKPEPNVQYATSSEQLAEEFVLLCNSLGVRANITHHDDRGKDEYTVSVSTPDLKPYADKLDLKHPDKRKAIEFLEDYEHRDTSRDVIPIGESLAKQMRSSLGHPRDCSDEHHTAYIELSNASDRGYITRGAYRRWKERELFEKMQDVDDTELLERFVDIAEADNIIWDRVESVEPAGENRTAYDLTVPDCNVFMASNGLILWDTFGIHVPSSEEANKEAADMKPSENMYLPGRAQDEMAQSLQHEYVLGLYQITREGDSKSKRFDGPEEAIEAAESGDLDWTDMVIVDGIGRTSPGRCRAMEPVPEDLRDYDLQLDDDSIHEMLKSIDQNKSKQAYLDCIEDWKHLARDYAYKSGSSFLLSDLQTLNDKRDRLYSRAEEEVDKVRNDPTVDDDDAKQKIIDMFTKADSALLESAKDLEENNAGRPNNISDMVDAGARGNPNQVKQLVATLGLMLDHKQETMTEPVKGNYAEGLDSGEHWQHMYSQRKGMIDKSQSVSGPGYLAKELTNVASGQTIVEKDCGTDQGRREDVDRHLLHRVIAETVGDVQKGTVIDETVLGKLRKSDRDQVKVRTPLDCQSTDGLCARCYGYDEDGHFPEIGKRIGMSEVQAMTERSTQLPMKSFHCLHRGSIVFVKTPEGDLYAPTQKELFHLIDTDAVRGEGWEEKYPGDGWRIWDAGTWVELQKVSRHHRENPLVGVRTDSGGLFVSQDNHPMVAKSSKVACPKCGCPRVDVLGSGKKDAYRVSCQSCEHIWHPEKETWQEHSPKIKMAKNVEEGDVFEVDMTPLGFKDGGAEDLSLPPYLLGMFLADGSFHRCYDSIPEEGSRVVRGQTRMGGFRIKEMTIFQKEGDIQDRILEELEKTGIPISKSGGEIKLNDVGLVREMVGHVGRLSSEKKLSKEFLIEASDNQMARVLCGLIDGDGTYLKNRSCFEFYSTSYALIQQVHMMCRCLGVHSKVRLKGNKGNYQGMAILIRPKQEDAWIFKHAEKHDDHTFDDEPRTSLNVDTFVSWSRPFYDENERWVYDVTTSSGTFVGAGVWNHNSGGVATAESGIANAFDRAKQILEMPNQVDNKATLAETSGTVDRIEESGFGGKKVYINGQEHEIPQGRDLEVEKGDQVQKGDKISSGVVKPQEMLEHKGLEATQEQIRDDLHDTFSQAGVNLQKKNHEMTTKMLTEKVRVKDPGDCNKFVPGDFTTLAKVKNWNQNNPDKDQIEYKSMLAGAAQHPHKGDDWAQRMSLNRIRQTMQEGAAQGFESSRRKGEGTPFADIALGPDTPMVEPGEEASESSSQNF